MAAEKLDLVKTYKTYYRASKAPALVEFGPISFLTLKGMGAPAGAEFASAVEALYPLAYGIKALCKAQGRDFGVPKLEGLWWVESDRPALQVPYEEWCWKLLIRMPDFVTQEMVSQAKTVVIEKKGIALIQEIIFAEIAEGQCVQIMHVGPYATEPESIAKLIRFMVENGLVANGLHHEIYLSDPRRTAPEKMKTILRQPVKEA
jgi:hypothetical protein